MPVRGTSTQGAEQHRLHEAEVVRTVHPVDSGEVAPTRHAPVVGFVGVVGAVAGEEDLVVVELLDPSGDHRQLPGKRQRRQFLARGHEAGEVPRLVRHQLLGDLLQRRGGNSPDDDTTTDTTDPTGTTDATPDTTDSGVTTPTATTDTGTPVAWVEEACQAPQARLEDILFVVDNSCSMADNQPSIRARRAGAGR